MRQKKILALILAGVLALSLAACSGGNDSEASGSSAPSAAPSQAAEPTNTPEPEDTPEPGPTAIPLSIGDSIDNDNFLMTFDSMELLDEYKYSTSEYSSTSLYVEDGYKLVVVKGHFENKATSAISDSAFSLSALVNGSYELDEHDVRMNFQRDKYFEIDAYTDQDYVLYINIPNKLAEQFETAEFSIGFNDDLSMITTVYNSDGTKTIEVDNLYTLSGTAGAAAPAGGDVSGQQSGDGTTPIQLGDKITTSDYEFTLNNVELTYELKPANTNGVYTSYEADSGKVYVHVDGTYYNTSKKDLHIRDLCQPDVDYDNGYTYSGFAVVDKDDNSFTWASSYVICTPLDTCHYHGLVECPDAIVDSDAPLFVTLKLADGVTYRYDIR